MVMIFKKVLSVLVLIGLCLTSYAKGKLTENKEEKKVEVQDVINKRLLQSSGLFEINDGQIDKEVKYRYSSPYANVDFYSDKVVFALRKMTKEHDFSSPEGFAEFDYTSWTLNLNTSEDCKMMQGVTVRPQQINYFSNSHKVIKKYSTDKVIYKNIYPNIDLVFYKNEENQLKYDMILHPGALLSDIKLNYEGVKDLRILDNGQLAYQTEWGRILEDAPYSYKQASGKEVKIKYTLNSGQLGFTANFNQVKETIVLDPIYIDWSTYFYGEGNPNGFAYAFTYVLDLDIDDDNNVYITGFTQDKFPTNPNAYDTVIGNGSTYNYDAFVCKMSEDGDSLLWFTYIGGNGFEYSMTLAVNSIKQPVISGYCYNGAFPTTPGAFSETRSSYFYWTSFVTKFSEDGDSLIFSTYLGGSSYDRVYSLELDESGNVFVAGRTQSTDFPVTSGCFQSTYGGTGTTGWYWDDRGDGFLTKLNSSGTALIFSTYIGGAEGDGIYQVALSPNNDIYVVGKTSSGNFPVTAGSSIFNYNVRGTTDGFVMKFQPNGSTLRYSKLMGGDDEDWFESVYVNSFDEAYVAGVSKSSNFYTTSGAYQTSNAGGADIVVVKMNALGQNVVYSTYLGGSGDEYTPYSWYSKVNVSIAANVREEAILCGLSKSSDFPVTGDALMTQNPSDQVSWVYNTSAVIAKLNYTGKSLLYGTYFGGSDYEYPGANKLKRISCFTNILYGGFTRSDDFPTTSGSYKPQKSANNAYWTGFVSKFRDTLYTDLIELAITDTITECDNVFEIMDAKNQGADILWSNGSTQRFQILEDTGTYWVQATYGCDTVRDTITMVLEYSPIVPVLPNDTTYCDQFPDIDLDAGNDSMLADYTWSNGDTNKEISIDQEGKYWVQIATPNCGTKTDTIRYKLLLTPDIELQDDTLLCDSVSLMLSSGLVDNEEIYSWNNGDSTSSIMVYDTGWYQMKAINFCGVDSSDVLLSMLHTPVVSLPNDTVYCDSAFLVLKPLSRPNNDESYYWYDISQSSGYGYFDSLYLTTSGFYRVTAENDCGSSSDSIAIGLLKTPTIDLGQDQIYCDTIELVVVAGDSTNAESYVWDNNSTQLERTLRTAGNYWARVTNTCGTAIDSIRLTQRFTPTVDIVNNGISVEDSLFCDDVNISLTAEINDVDATYAWSTGANTPSIAVTDVGTYKIDISSYCGTATDEVIFTKIESPVVELGPEKVFCGTLVPYDIEVGQEDNQELYTWSSGANSNTNTISSEGKHWVEISNKCATVADTLYVRVSPYPVVDLGRDSSLCGDFKLELDAGNPGMSYSWEPFGETSQTIIANEQRVYRVTVTNSDNCASSDEMEITSDCISHYYIPNAFTPNKNGVNEVFRPSLINYMNYEMRIYSRWGELLFSTNDPEEGWDGTYEGVDVQQGTYMYVIKFVATEDLQHKNISGVLYLLR